MNFLQPIIYFKRDFQSLSILVEQLNLTSNQLPSPGFYEKQTKNLTLVL